MSAYNTANPDSFGADPQRETLDRLADLLESPSIPPIELYEILDEELEEDNISEVDEIEDPHHPAFSISNLLPEWLRPVLLDASDNSVVVLQLLVTAIFLQNNFTQSFGGEQDFSGGDDDEYEEEDYEEGDSEEGSSESDS